jgi:anaerobic selenocysteine-containing dehydrogenase
MAGHSIRYRMGACTLDCPDACSFKVGLSGGRIVRLKGNPAHPVTRGFICPRPRVVMKMSSGEDRLLYPSLKVKGGRRRISWDEALDIILEKMAPIRTGEKKALAILGIGSTGVNRHAVKHFFRKLGFLECHGSLCDQAGIEAFQEDTGSLEMNDPRELLNAGGIVLWGKMPSASSPHMAALVRQAVKQGAQLAVISPQRIPMAGRAVLDIRIRPGGDIHLATLVSRFLLEEGLHSGEAERRSDNFEDYRRMVFRHPPEKLAAAADVEISQAARLAGFLVGHRPVSALVGQGLQRYRHGLETVRSINAAIFLSGNMGRKGAGSYYNISSSRDLNLDWMAPKPVETISMPLISRELSARQDELGFVWVGATNIVNQAPDALKVGEALRSIPFSVAVDAFLNDTVESSSLALPAALMMERSDVASSFGHDWLGWSPALIDPPGEALGDFEIIKRLADRLGVEGPWASLEEYLSLVLDSPSLRGDLTSLRKRGFIRARRPRVAYRGNVFPRPGGKFRFLEELPPPSLPVGRAYPLYFLTVVSPRYQHSQIPTSEQREPLPVSLHPETARGLGLSDGEDVYIKSPLGMMPAVLNLDEGLHPEVLLAPRGGWLKTGRGVNALIAPRVTDRGHTAAYYRQKVILVSADGEA